MPTPEFERFQRAFEAGVPEALTAAALLYQAALRPKLQRGYTSGNFTQGIQAAAVQVTPPELVDGDAQVTVGTNELVSLYWEMGHQNLFTRKYERVEYWRETMEELAPAMAEQFGVTLSTRLEVAAG